MSFIYVAVTLVSPTPTVFFTADPVYRDCSDLPPNYPSGVYTLRLGLESQDVEAYCDMDHDGGGWTVLIRRDDIEPREYFYRDWDAYKWGFGYLKQEFYWGNEYIWMLTSHIDRQYQMRFWLEDWENATRYAVYENFTIEAEDGHYRLHIGEYSGDAGDSLYLNNNQPFSTYDRDYDDYDDYNCAEDHEGAWWYWRCSHCQLTGKYYDGGSTGGYWLGIFWYDWKGYRYSLKAAVMKIRPSDKA